MYNFGAETHLGAGVLSPINVFQLAAIAQALALTCVGSTANNSFVGS